MSPFFDDCALARAAQSRWSRLPIRDRLRPVRAFRSILAERADEFTAVIHAEILRDPDELIATDIVPTASAAKFLERQAARLLAPRKVGGRPIWLWGFHDTVHHRPHGIVGLIGTWNYPVFLNAIPILHALTAGNAVLWKPSEQVPKTAELLSRYFVEAGFPPDLIRRLPATREAGPDLARAEIDHLHFTGSEPVGRKLAAQLGERLIPSTLELSGCDALHVMADADVELAASLAWYGTTLNSGQTCIAVRRAFVHRTVYTAFIDSLKPLVMKSRPGHLVMEREADRMRQFVDEAQARGCEVINAPGLLPTVILNPNAIPGLPSNRESIFAPLLTVTPFDTIEDAIALAAESPFRLSASILTRDLEAAQDLASRLSVGTVVVNDVIIPTAHPGTPFGGRGASGWSVSQGNEGLLAMTVPQVISIHTGSIRSQEEASRSPGLPRAYLRLVHGRGFRLRWSGFRQLLAGIWKRR